MRSPRTVALAMLVVGMCGFGTAHAIAPPSEGFFTAADLDTALALTLASGDSVVECGGVAAEPGVLSVGGDNSSCHYARGSTMIVHVFVKWNASPVADKTRNDAAAIAETAKMFFRNQLAGQTAQSPAAANLSFDHEGDHGYYYYEAQLDPADSNVPAYFVVMGSGPRYVLQALGVQDADRDGFLLDDFTFELQEMHGGWDNVIVVIHPGTPPGGNVIWNRSYAFGTGEGGTQGGVVYLGGGRATTMAHEWAHCFGAADEYVDSPRNPDDPDDPDDPIRPRLVAQFRCSCAVPSWPYLTASTENANCVVEECGTLHVPCLMVDDRAGHFLPFCAPSRVHMSWDWVTPGNPEGVPPVFGTAYPDAAKNIRITDLHHDVAVTSTDATNAWAYPQATRAWAVAGLRSPSGSNFDVQLFADNNHRIPLGRSEMTGSAVDFVVGDYHLNNLGNEHLRILRAQAGSNTSYDVSWESGGEVLVLNAPAVSVGWTGRRVARVWDLPLTAGQAVRIQARGTAGGLDAGLALFRATGSAYFAGRSGAVASADAGGAGAIEQILYTAPATGVYGLVVWSNGVGDGTLSLLASSDFSPPSQVTALDVEAQDCWNGTAVVGWTAPGDDGTTGTAAEYDFRSSPAPINANNFATAYRLPTGAPLPAGSHETVEVGVAFGARRYYAMRALDEVGNASPISPNIWLQGPPSQDYCVEWSRPAHPAVLALLPPEPNPAHGAVRLRYSIPDNAEGQAFELGIFDVAGRRLADLGRGGAAAGEHQAEWRVVNESGLPVGGGMYFARLRVGTKVMTRTIVVAH